MKHVGVIPRYQQIAADIAGKIVNGTYNIGDRIFSRSGLSIQYGVSGETARRAIVVLADKGVVEVRQGSACIVSSYEKAKLFRNQFYSLETVGNLGAQLQQMVDRQREGLTELESTMKNLADRIAYYQNDNPLIPIKITIMNNCVHLGKSIGEIGLWQHTGVTVVALYRSGVLEISPGPYVILEANDELYIVSSSDGLGKLNKFLYSK